ncbi:class II aldolase/adducin family protein [Holophaga foetida]|uniref:class II aldolase/adducin family protein n=1 Tax=Holophaga foetida TaxID=35839 RepID=UPI0002472EE7|nr:class II aldolase/adducin family protein [Holophaga foetida]
MNLSHPAEDMEVILQEICESCRRLYARNLLAGGDGNVSWRFPDGRIAMTPSGVSKRGLRPGDLAWLSLEGEVLLGSPSSERLMHLAVYRACPEARCVVHAHPPTTIAWTLARPEWDELPSGAMPEVILAAGRIPVVPYARPGTPALGESLIPHLPAHRLLALARHGGLAWGESLEEACNGMERLEHICQILKTAQDLGGFTELPPEEREVLRVRRAAMGPRLL